MSAFEVLVATERASAVVAGPGLEHLRATTLGLAAWLAVGLAAWLAVSVAMTLALGATIRRRDRQVPSRRGPCRLPSTPPAPDDEPL
jgi:hypothetical protein